MQKVIVLQVPAWPDATLADIYNNILKFGLNNGDGVAKNFEEAAMRWPEDRPVCLCPIQPDANFDCIHSLYGSVMPLQTTAINLLGVHGLFCLAAYLKQNESTDLQSFTGVVHALGGSKLSEKTGMNHNRGAPWRGFDLLTPVLYIEQGRPRSIYTMWHSDDTEDASLIAFCGNVLGLELEEIAREAA